MLVNAGLWQDFNLLTIPLAVYDGTNTYLWNHPSPPSDFEKLADGSNVYLSSGRHPSLVANSVAEINGTNTATVFYVKDEQRREIDDWLPLLAHEAFHVYQRDYLENRGANEADLFLYPFDDAHLLTWRRLETYALRKALSASAEEGKAGWAQVALDYRNRRFGAMQEAFVTYERGTELIEGTATYVEYKVAAKSPDLKNFAATKVRQRGYETGAAFCFLLDEFTMGWQERLMSDNQSSLDGLLGETLSESTRKGIDRRELGAIANQAQRDVEQLRLERKEKRTTFDNAEGWKLILLSNDADLLRVEEFDPLNVAIVEGGVLHERYLNLAASATQVEILNAQCLTEARGDHPLFSGVKLATINLKDKPKISKDGEVVRIESDSVNGTVSASAVAIWGRHIEIGISN